MITSNFEYYDSQVMHAICAGQRFLKRGATLKQIINTGDAIYRWTLTFSNFKNAIIKLSAYGLIDIKHNKIYVTKKYYTYKKKSKKANKTLVYESDKIQVILNEVSSKENFSLKDLPNDFLDISSWHDIIKH